MDRGGGILGRDESSIGHAAWAGNGVDFVEVGDAVVHGVGNTVAIGNSFQEVFG